MYPDAAVVSVALLMLLSIVVITTMSADVVLAGGVTASVALVVSAHDPIATLDLLVFLIRIAIASVPSYKTLADSLAPAIL